MARVYPGATRTFTVLRRGPVLQSNGNTLMGETTIVTGLSVALTAGSGVVDNDESGPQALAQYRAATFLDAPLFISDILVDEHELERDGTPVKYQIQAKTLGAFAMALRLERTMIQ